MENLISKDESKEKGICLCMCHEEDKTTMHMMPCCENTYKAYINKDGMVDINKYEALQKAKVQI